MILIISISAVSAADNSTVVESSSDDLQTSDAPVGGDELLQSAEEDDILSGDGADGDKLGVVDASKGNASSFTIEGSDMYHYYKSDPVPAYEFKIVDSESKGIKTNNVKVSIVGKTYTVKTSEDGKGSLKLNLRPGTYKVVVKYNNTSITHKITLFKSRITVKDLYSTYGTPVKYTIKVVNNNGKPMKGAKVSILRDNKVFYHYADANGMVTFKMSYQAGTHIIKYHTGTISGQSKYVVKNKIALIIMKWGNKGDVSKAYLIKTNIPNNEWVKKMVAATKQGNPLIIIQGANSKKVFMTAGVHGNELAPQIAAMKTIDYLTKTPVKGTVYFMPFVNIKAITNHVRLTDYDYNRIAHKKGTVSNNIVNLIIKYKCDNYADFHSTVRPGIPGQNIILGYKSPAKKCVDLTNYLAKNCKVNKRLYSYAGQVYAWALADRVNHMGTPAVICEVVSPVNKASPQSISLSYKMMNSYLKYNSLIR